MKVCLSPNGRNVFTGKDFPNQLLVATVDGMSSLERQNPIDS